MNTYERTILVVEDEPDILRIIRHMLTAAGYNVVPAYDGEDALRKIQKRRFDLVLTDLSMPRMSGVELIERVRNDPALASIPIVAVTAYTWDGLGRSAADYGCNGFVPKPIDPKALLRTVARYLIDSGAANESRPPARAPLARVTH